MPKTRTNAMSRKSEAQVRITGRDLHVSLEVDTKPGGIE